MSGISGAAGIINKWLLPGSPLKAHIQRGMFKRNITKTINIEKWRLIAAIVCFTIMGYIIGQVFPANINITIVKPVYASGSDIFTANITDKTNYSSILTASFVNDYLWGNAIALDNADDDNDGSLQVGFKCAGPTENTWGLHRGMFGFNISSLPANIEVTGMRVKLYGGSKTNTKDWVYYVSLYQTPNDDTDIELDDYDDAFDNPQGRVMVAAPKLYSDISLAAYNTFEIYEGYFDILSIPDANGFVWFTLASMNDMLNNAPQWYTDYENTSIIFSGANPNYYKLEIDYVEATPPRTITYDSNAAVDNVTDGTEVADNITWGSPRAGYADEGLYFIVNGDSGAAIDLELRDSDGNILKEVVDSIRVDGNYDWYIDLADDWFGWVRAIESNHNLISDWGYQMPSPDADQQGNLIYAVNTEYPQYDFAFPRYLTFENDPFVLHWKTNVQSGEHDSHKLEIWGNGDNVTFQHFSKTLEWLNDNYYDASANNSELGHWRYMIFTPNIEGSGFEDYDGMIYDLNINYTSITAGFFQGIMLDTSDNTVLANSHSCYWYIPNQQDGLIFQIGKPTYRKGDDMLVKLQVGSACKIDDSLPSLTIQIIDSNESVVSTAYETFVVGENEYQLLAPTIAGDYEVRFTFSGVPSWDYIHDEPFNVTGKAGLVGADSIIDSLKTWVEDLGMDNPAGYWMLLLLGMVFLFLIAYKSPIMRVAFPMIYLGFFLVMEFIDMWIIIILGLGAALTLYRLFQRRVHGGGGDSE